MSASKYESIPRFSIVDGTYLCILPSPTSLKSTTSTVVGVPIQLIPACMSLDLPNDNEQEKTRNSRSSSNITSEERALEEEISDDDQAKGDCVSIEYIEVDLGSGGNVIEKADYLSSNRRSDENGSVCSSDHQRKAALVDDGDGLLVHRRSSDESLILSVPSMNVFDKPSRNLSVLGNGDHTLLEAENVGSVLIADFSCNGLEQILLLPEICRKKKSLHVEQVADFDKTFVSLAIQEKVLRSVLRRSALTDGRDIIHGVHVANRAKRQRQTDVRATRKKEHSGRTLHLVKFHLDECDGNKKNVNKKRRRRNTELEKHDANKETAAIPTVTATKDVSLSGGVISGSDDAQQESKEGPLAIIEEGLRERLLAESAAALREENLRKVRLNTIEKARDLACSMLSARVDDNSHVASSSLKDSQMRGSCIPVFKSAPSATKQQTLYAGSGKEGCPVVQSPPSSSVFPYPLEMVKLCWKPLHGGKTVELSVDVLGFPHRMWKTENLNDVDTNKKSNVDDSENNNSNSPSCLLDVFLSCSTRLFFGKTMQTKSGVVPRLQMGECVTIKAIVEGITFDHGADNVTIGIDIMWKQEATIAISSGSKPQQQGGMLLGVLKLPLEALMLTQPSSVIDFRPQDLPRHIQAETTQPPITSMAVFDYRNPLVLQLSSIDYKDIARDEAFWRPLSQSLRGGGQVELDSVNEHIVVFGESPQGRAELLQLVLKYLPNSTKLIQATSNNKSRTSCIRALVESISNEIQTLKQHLNLPAESVKTSILQDILELQITTDEIASLLQREADSQSNSDTEYK